MKNKTTKKKRTARVLTYDGRREFWTTQTQFWEWARARTITKLGDAPLTGRFCVAAEEHLVLRGGAVLNRAAPHHLQEFMITRARSR